MVGRHEEMKSDELNLHTHAPGQEHDQGKKNMCAAVDSIYILAGGGNNSIVQTPASNLTPATTNPPSRLAKLP